MSTTLSPDDLNRDELAVGDTEVRLYYHEALDKPLPSVTSIVDIRDDPGKDAAIQGWKDKYDGSTKYRSPHWEDQLSYKGYRGTLGHFAMLSHLAEMEETEEEVEARENLKEFGEYDGEDAWKKCMRDLNWAIKEFEAIVEDKGLTSEHVYSAEKFVYDEEYGFAGQYDLCYEDPNTGETVLCDLKLASGIREGYKYQLAAYAFAIDEHVDRLEIIRIHPDSKEVEVERDTDWEMSTTEYIEAFMALVSTIHERHDFADYIDDLE